MAHSSPSCQNFIVLARSFKRLHVSDPLTQCLAPRLSRSYATHADLPTTPTTARKVMKSSSPSSTLSATTAPKPSSSVVTTLYSWPSMEPSALSQYPSHQLNVPLRRDILHRAVVYEGDNTRQGSAAAKHRTQVHGSARKIRPQKGTGNARLSDRKSPSMRGGGVAHGPHPRDFATDLPRKIYDLAWRTALSYRYKKGELIVLRNKVVLPEDCSARWLNNFFINNGWGKGNGRSLVVLHPTEDARTSEEEVSPRKEEEVRLMNGMSQIGEHAKVKTTSDVDVKDLLSCGRVIIEQKALRAILWERSRFAV